MQSMDRPSTCEAAVRQIAADASVVWLGRLGYTEALELQLGISESKKRGLEEDFLLLLEHPPTITLGRNGNWNNLIAPPELLEERGVLRFETDRGGDITFHGPGQLVAYPILRLENGERDVRRYMRNLEESLIRLLAQYGIESHRDQRYTGVWTGRGKIAAMGVHISRWITRHGIALNVNTDLSFYNLIVPCGIAARGVTSMAAILGKTLDLPEVAERYAKEFGRVFSRGISWMETSALRSRLGQPIQPGASGGERHEG
jgi:lipoyl(octanoyl) transferase